MGRVSALVAKEIAELRASPSIVLPILIVAAASLLPFFIAIGIPWLMGEELAGDGDLDAAVERATRFTPGLARLGPEAAVQAFLAQQFLLLLVLVPVTGAMALAAHSVIGEKQARTLEPLLASPIGTLELLGAKVTAALIPSLAIEAAALALYLGLVWWAAEPGVLAVLVSLRTLLIVGVLGPLAALVALELAVIVSSRVNDPRSAQQIGVLVIMPIVGLLIAQFAGVLWLTVPMILSIALALAVVCGVLAVAGVALFERETILTRWK